MRILATLILAAILTESVMAQTDTQPSSNPQQDLQKRGAELGRAQIQQQQELQNQIALAKAQAVAAADAQIKVDKARANEQDDDAVQQSVVRAVAEYPDSSDPDSALGKAIAKRFATMPDADPLWQNPNRAEIVARQEAIKLGIKGKSESQPAISSHKVEVGTGFFVTTNGYLLTDFHVVAGAQDIQIKDAKGMHPATLVARDPTNDLAVLKVDGTTKCLPLGDSAKVTLGQGVFTVGFPNPDIQGINPKLTKGEVNSLAGIQDDPRMYQISAPVQPGNSGGCLVDDFGNVVGIISSKLDAVAMANATGDVPQNVNYALKISYAKLLLETLPDSKTFFLTPNIAIVPFDKDVTAVQDSTVMVIAQ